MQLSENPVQPLYCMGLVTYLTFSLRKSPFHVLTMYLRGTFSCNDRLCIPMNLLIGPYHRSDYYRYSIWIDSKLRLNADPVLIIEKFLWQTRSEYAISNHYDRHCVWEEVLQNKRLNKFNHTAIDEQFQFYQSDGLIKFNESDENTPLPSCESFSCFSLYKYYLQLPELGLSAFVLQMYLKVHLLCVLTHPCRTCFHVFGSMR